MICPHTLLLRSSRSQSVLRGSGWFDGWGSTACPRCTVMSEGRARSPNTARW